jgi:hypothetical protein
MPVSYDYPPYAIPQRPAHNIEQISSVEQEMRDLGWPPPQGTIKVMRETLIRYRLRQLENEDMEIEGRL